MELVRDAHIIHLIERISEYYRTNIANHFTRPALMQLPLDETTWDLVESLTEKYEQFRYQGFPLEELYRQVAALARFISATRREVAPALRYRLNGKSMGAADKVLRDMTVNTFSANLELFARLVCDLYKKIIDFDVSRSSKEKRPLYQQQPEFASLDEIIMSG